MPNDDRRLAELAEEIRAVSVQLHWFNAKLDGEHKCLQLAEALQNKTAEYLSLLLHNMREHGEDVSVQPPLIGD
jgi:predicted phage tail protein